jgi:hypothetical protein
VWLEGLGQLKIPVTSLGFEPATFLLVALVPQPTTLPRTATLFMTLCKARFVMHQHGEFWNSRQLIVKFPRVELKKKVFLLLHK